MARSGIAAARLLHEKGEYVIINDRKTEADFDGALDELRRDNIEWRLGEDALDLLPLVNQVVISPGIPIEHPAVLRAQEMGIEVIGEVELAYRMSMGRVVAITGTNGKTTTTTLLGEIFKNAGKRTFVVGNIGTPYAGIAAESRADDVIVCEISSFQLETIDKYHPVVSAILNITEDHLNRHHTMERYAQLKARVFENQKDDEGTVLNYDDPILREMAQSAMCKVVWFSRTQQPPFGAFVQDGNIVFGTPDNARTICAVDEVYIPGPHNLENALAATACAMQAGVPAAVIRHTLRTFTGVEHRIETVCVKKGVTFINDSKATNPDSAIKAVETMKKPTVLLLGGSEKHSDYTQMCKVICESGWIRHAVTLGDTGEAIAQALEKAGFANIHRTGHDFKETMYFAASLAEEGGNVLLSPACASFDMFNDYEHRGAEFKRIAREMPD